MSSSLRLGLIGLLLVVLLGVGAWYYLLGPNMVSSAELVPGDAVAFATLPNATKVASDYRGSQLKQLVDSPDFQPLLGILQDGIGHKNVDLLNALLPCLSGQSFIAITHFDPQHPEHLGIIAAMRPKLGFDRFDKFVEQVKTVYSVELKQGTVGTGQVDGFSYQSVQGPGGADKLCVARVRGWIVTTWGEAPLQDFIERVTRKSGTPNLAQVAAYQNQIARVGKDAEGFVYADASAFQQIADWWMPSKNAQPDYFTQKLKGASSFAVGTRFINGEISDHFSVLTSTSSPAAAPCPFDTLKFTGPDTRLYWAANIDWAATWKEMPSPDAQPNIVAATLLHFLQNWTKSEPVDVDQNIIGALGPELSVQAEWTADNAYPDIGLIVKVDKPDQFKPVISALIDSVRKAYSQLAVVNEIAVNGNNLATLKFIQAIPFSPTITEDGPYFGIFLTETQAAQCLARDGTIGLLRNDDFNRQTADKRQGASQLLFLDTPKMLEHAYGTLGPFLSMASMFNPTMGSWVKAHPLPPDLNWVAPIGTWSFTLSPDGQGFQGTSISGVGNQGVFLGGLMSAGSATPMVQDQMRRMSALVQPPAPPPSPVSLPIPAVSSVTPAATPAPDSPTNGLAAPAPPDAPKPQ